jgi:hypothetical protein
LPVRTFLSQDESFDDVAMQVREVTIRNFQYQDYPFNLLLEKVVKDTTIRKADIFSVGFTWHSPLDEIETSGLDFAVEKYESRNEGHAQTDFWFHGYQDSDGIMIGIEYDKQLFKEDTVQYVAQGLKQIIRQALESPSISIGDIQLGPERIQSEKQVINVDLDI